MPYSRPVLAVFAVAFLTMYVISAVEWTLLPFLRHVSPIGVVSSTRYIILAAIPQLVPIVSNSVLGWLASHCGTAPVLGTFLMIVALGIALMIVFSHSPTLVAVGLCLYSPLTGMEMLRVAMVSDLVATTERTAALACHYLMAPLGGLTAPLAWVAIQNVMGDARLSGPSGFVIDRFTVNHGISAIFMLSSGVLLCLFRQSMRTPAEQQRTDVEQQSLYGALKEEPLRENNKKDGTTKTATNSSSSSHQSPPLKRSALWTFFAIFTCLQLSVRLAHLVAMATLQPTLMHRFGVSEKGVAHAYLSVSVMALIPPVVIAYVSRHLTDRQIMMFGLLLKLVGAAMYLPLLGGATPARVTVGFALVIMASAFSTTALLSFFSKTVADAQTRAALLGYMWSIANGIPAILQVVCASAFYNWVGTWYFSLFFAPTLLSAIFVASPRFEEFALPFENCSGN